MAQAVRAGSSEFCRIFRQQCADLAAEVLTSVQKTEGLVKKIQANEAYKVPEVNLTRDQFYDALREAYRISREGVIRLQDEPEHLNRLETRVEQLKKQNLDKPALERLSKAKERINKARNELTLLARSLIDWEARLDWRQWFMVKSSLSVSGSQRP